MTDREKRVTLAGIGLLTGLIAALLTVAVPWLIGRVGLPIVIFTGNFIGGIFGIVIAVYFWIFLGERSAWRLLAFILASTVAYIAAMFATMFSTMAMPLSHGGPWASTGTDVSVGGFLIGGAVGGFIVFLAALICFSERKLSRAFLTALELSSVGAILGGLGWAAGPSLGNSILHVIGETVNPYTNAQAACSYSLFLVWQTGMGLTIGWLFPRQPVEVPASSDPASAAGSSQVTRIARIALFAAATLTLVFFAVREFPQSYQSAQWQRAYKKHVAEKPPLVNPPSPAEAPSPKTSPIQIPEKPSLENLPAVQAVAPDRMLILHSIGEYVPRVVSPDARALASQHSGMTYYLVRYAIPGAPSDNPGPVLWVQVEDYPNAAWAQYKVLQRLSGINANSKSMVKFGNRVYGRTTEGDGGQDGSYLWWSANRLVDVSWFHSADTDAVLKAYLERYPSFERRSAEDSPNQHSETPSQENLREVQLLEPKQMLILHQLGQYVPDSTRAGKTITPKEAKAAAASSSKPQSYWVKYDVPDAPLFAGRFRPTVEVRVEEYPDATWAQYELFQHAPGLASGNSPRPVKFGSLLYGNATEGAKGQNGLYTWASRNRLINISFDLAEPDDILKAYLEKFPTSEKASPEDVAQAQAGGPEQMLVLHPFGDYVPQRPYSGTTVQPPLAKYYSVRYALPGASSMGKTGPVVDVEVYEYPSAAWAKYEIFEQGGRTDLANPARSFKFGNRIYGQAKAAAIGQSGAYNNGQIGEYVWASGNRLIVIRFYSAEPDEVLKAYLEKFPTAPTDRL
jgi:hypothetical protein